MKKQKKIFMFVGVFVVIILLWVIIVSVVINNQYKQFSVLETGQLRSDLYVINDEFVNVFVLQKEGEYLVVDSGNNQKNIEEGFNKLGLDINKVSVLLLTHTDFDHVAQVNLYKNASVYISEEEEKMINGEINKKPFIHNKLNTKYSLLLNNGVQQISNWKIQTILVPGHTCGSVCYVINDKYLFTGDSISLRDGKVMPFNDFFNMDTKQQIDNIPNICNLDNIDLVLTAHYGISDNYDRAFGEFNNLREDN
jgi:glyoxylase-like metal-dependent hydrolase (beta-lactamase superfamily II)